MTFWIVRRFYDINATKFIGIERETEIQNSSMIRLLTEGRRTLFWACGTMKANGVMTRTVSWLLHQPTLRKSTLLSHLVVSRRSPMPSLHEYSGDECRAHQNLHQQRSHKSSLATPPYQALGPDDMSAIFFHKYQSFVGSDVTTMVLNVLNLNMSIAELNKTNISLIPKSNNSTKMTEFQPISLCNVVYKLISKVLANRLKVILPHVITENQSAFTL